MANQTKEFNSLDALLDLKYTNDQEWTDLIIKLVRARFSKMEGGPYDCKIIWLRFSSDEDYEDYFGGESEETFTLKIVNDKGRWDEAETRAKLGALLTLELFKIAEHGSETEAGAPGVPSQHTIDQIEKAENRKGPAPKG